LPLRGAGYRRRGQSPPRRSRPVRPRTSSRPVLPHMPPAQCR
jgi:hypothetical protein